MSDRPIVVVVAPDLLEPATKRGGGIELVDLEIALRLSTELRFILVGPYYLKHVELVTLSEGVSIKHVRFPAMWNYPPSSTIEQGLLTLFHTPVYAMLLMCKLVSVLREDVSAMIVHNGLPGLVGSIIARISGVGILFSEGNSTPWTNPYLGKPVIPPAKRAIRAIQSLTGRLVASLADSIIVQSDSIRIGMTNSGIANGKIHVVPAGVDTKAFLGNQTQKADDHPFTIGFVGRLTEEKEAPLLVELIAAAERKLPDVRFSIFGDGPYRKELEGHLNVVQIGSVDHDSLPSKLADASAVIYLQKDIGLALLECMAAGKALVASDAGNIREIIIHKMNGLIVDPSTPNFIDAIRLLKDSPGLLMSISTAARGSIESRYDWNIVAKEWEMHIMKIIGRPTARV